MWRIQAVYFRKSSDFCKLRSKIYFRLYKVYINLNSLKTFKSQNLDSVEVGSKLMDEEELNSSPPPLQFKFTQKWVILHFSSVLHIVVGQWKRSYRHHPSLAITHCCVYWIKNWLWTLNSAKLGLKCTVKPIQKCSTLNRRKFDQRLFIIYFYQQQITEACRFLPFARWS